MQRSAEAFAADEGNQSRWNPEGQAERLERIFCVASAIRAELLATQKEANVHNRVSGGPSQQDNARVARCRDTGGEGEKLS